MPAQSTAKYAIFAYGPALARVAQRMAGARFSRPSDPRGKPFDIAPLAPLRQPPNLSCAPAGFDKGVERYDLRALSAMKAITPGAAAV